MVFRNFILHLAGNILLLSDIDWWWFVKSKVTAGLFGSTTAY
jgi:hypothetical protein